MGKLYKVKQCMYLKTALSYAYKNNNVLIEYRKSFNSENYLDDTMSNQLNIYSQYTGLSFKG